MIVTSQFLEAPVPGATGLGMRCGVPMKTTVKRVDAAHSSLIVTLIAADSRITVGSLQEIYVPKGGKYVPRIASAIEPGDRVVLVLSGMPVLAKVSGKGQSVGDTSVLRLRTTTRNIVIGGFLCRA